MAPALEPLKLRTLQCPNCGGTVELRGFAHTRSAVCIQCLSVIDTAAPELAILQKFDAKVRVQPVIPLGKRGKLHGVQYEVIGFQVRTVTVEGVDYSWHEYLLFSPYQGFRYLTLYDGHWNDVVTLNALPVFGAKSGRRVASSGGVAFSHFQSSTARTTFVMGEFPWQVQVGEEVHVDDYVSPPLMLSAEVTPSEIVWSRGEYTPGATIWQAFQLKGIPPQPHGVFANQPNPNQGRPGQIWSTFLKLAAAWFVVLLLVRFSARNEQAYRHSFSYNPADTATHSVVTDVFELRGSQSNAEVEIRSDLRGESAYMHLALANGDSGRAIDFHRNVTGDDRAIIHRVAPGRYYLRIEPQLDSRTVMNYEVIVRRGVPTASWLLFALPLLLIPPIVVSVRSGGFETARWQESDYSR
jgi:hypothetical protein